MFFFSAFRSVIVQQKHLIISLHHSELFGPPQHCNITKAIIVC